MASADEAGVEVRAAGGVVWDQGRVAIVHRPRYEDWTLPKGKLDPGETWEQAAEREVLEETGLRCALGPELSSATYTDHKGRSKLVRYWLMTDPTGAFEVNEEVDELRWVPVEDAVARLSYDRDQLLVREAATAAIGLGKTG